MMRPPLRTRRFPRGPHAAAQRPRRLGSREPFGYTLLEVLLALSLTVILVFAIYEALELHWRTSTTSRVEVERSQLARAILRKIELDIRSVIYEEPAAGSASVSATAGSESETGSSETETDATETEAAPSAGTSAGVFGDKSNIVLHISRPSRDLNYSSVLDGDAIDSRTSDLQSVSYFLAIPGASGLQGAVGDIAIPNAGAAGAGQVAGLARLEGDRLAIDLSDSEQDLEALAPKAEMLATEVRQLEFAYFDGVDWVDTWDTVSMGRLPRAVGVTIGFGWSDTEMAALGIDPDTASIKQYRLVVVLPLSEPYASEEDL